MWKFNTSRRYRISDELYHYNHNHDALGRFAKSVGNFVNGYYGDNPGKNNTQSFTKDELKELEEMENRDNRSSTKRKVAFGNNKECSLVVENSSHDVAKRIINDKNLDNRLRKITSDALYQYRLNESKNESEEEYRKNLKCTQITTSKRENVSDFTGSKTPEYMDSVFWYGNPKDFGEYMIYYDSKTKKVVYHEPYR